MSRIGKQPIKIPTGVTVDFNDTEITVKGPKGELKQSLHPMVKLSQADDILTVSVNDPEEKSQRSLWGLFERLITNMVIGVSEGFSKKLEVNGVGYKAVLNGKVLNLNLGYSHPIDFEIPEDISIEVEKNIITVSGIDKQVVGQAAANIRSFRKPEPYKGKGIKYSDEIIRRKAGKTAGKGA